MIINLPTNQWKVKPSRRERRQQRKVAGFFAGKFAAGLLNELIDEVATIPQRIMERIAGALLQPAWGAV